MLPYCKTVYQVLNQKHSVVDYIQIKLIWKHSATECQMLYLDWFKSCLNFVQHLFEIKKFENQVKKLNIIGLLLVAPNNFFRNFTHSFGGPFFWDFTESIFTSFKLYFPNNLMITSNLPLGIRWNGSFSFWIIALLRSSDFCHSNFLGLQVENPKSNWNRIQNIFKNLNLLFAIIWPRKKMWKKKDRIKSKHWIMF